MNRPTRIKRSVWQPLTLWPWPFDLPTRLHLGIQARRAPALPEDGNGFWQWALSGRDIENIRRYGVWLSLEFSDRDVPESPRLTKALELIKSTRLAVQIVAPVGCLESTILVRNEESVSATVHLPPINSTPGVRYRGSETVPSLTCGESSTTSTLLSIHPR